jgi:adenylate kinase family enzyme
VSEEDSDIVIETMFEKARYHSHVIVDGFPRDLKQAQKHKGKIDRVYNLMVSNDECIRRLSMRGRADDTPVVIAKRLQLYYERTVPVLEWFEKLAVLEKVDGERSADAVFDDLYTRIKRMLQIGEADLMR